MKPIFGCIVLGMIAALTLDVSAKPKPSLTLDFKDAMAALQSIAAIGEPTRAHVRDLGKVTLTGYDCHFQVSPLSDLGVFRCRSVFSLFTNDGVRHPVAYFAEVWDAYESKRHDWELTVPQRREPCVTKELLSKDFGVVWEGWDTNPPVCSLGTKPGKCMPPKVSQHHGRLKSVSGEHEFRMEAGQSCAGWLGVAKRDRP